MCLFRPNVPLGVLHDTSRRPSSQRLRIDAESHGGHPARCMGCARCSILRTPFAHGALLFFWGEDPPVSGCGHRCFGKLADTTGAPARGARYRLAVGCMGHHGHTRSSRPVHRGRLSWPRCCIASTLRSRSAASVVASRRRCALATGSGPGAASTAGSRGVSLIHIYFCI